MTEVGVYLSPIGVQAYCQGRHGMAKRSIGANVVSKVSGEVNG
jgi:hypothetical protein